MPEIDSDKDTPKDDQWIIEGMMPIAVAHAEAAARAAGVSIAEWLSQLISENTLAPAGESSSSKSTNDTARPSRNDSPRLR